MIYICFESLKHTTYSFDLNMNPFTQFCYLPDNSDPLFCCAFDLFQLVMKFNVKLPRLETIIDLLQTLLKHLFAVVNDRQSKFAPQSCSKSWFIYVAPYLFSL